MTAPQRIMCTCLLRRFCFEEPSRIVKHEGIALSLKWHLAGLGHVHMARPFERPETVRKDRSIEVVVFIALVATTRHLVVLAREGVVMFKHMRKLQDVEVDRLARNPRHVLAHAEGVGAGDVCRGEVH